MDDNILLITSFLYAPNWILQNNIISIQDIIDFKRCDEGKYWFYNDVSVPFYFCVSHQSTFGTVKILIFSILKTVSGRKLDL